jgi:peptide/nickel transport system ATP-binding protein
MCCGSRHGPVPHESVRTALERVELGLDPQFTGAIRTSSQAAAATRSRSRWHPRCQPPVAVLDEPTTGLDVLTQEKILLELRRLRDEEE